MKAAQVQTVTGPIPVDDLGIVLPHEHLIGRAPGSGPFKWNWDKFREDAELMRRELQYFRAVGGRTVVDLSCIGTGRPDPRETRKLSEDAGVQVVIATGLYEQDFLDDRWLAADLDEVTEFLVGEARQGVAGTDIRPGIIGEMATGGDEIRPVEERNLKAAARAQAETGLAVSTHCYMGRFGLEQLEILVRAGADPARVAIGHQDAGIRLPIETTLAVHLEIAQRGAFVQYDNFGKDYMFPEEWRLDLVSGMFEHGFGDQVLLSHDVNLRKHLVTHGGFGFGHVVSRIVPQLYVRGFSTADVHQLIVSNPAQLLAGSRPPPPARG